MEDLTRAPLTVTNENWMGKNDPTERRRIQNRINQRAFRQRQREGESPKPYRSRVSSNGSASPPLEDEERASPDPNPRATQPHGTTTPSAGRQVDELARLINRNFRAAACANAQSLGISPPVLQQTELGLTPRSNRAVTAALIPIAAQYQVPHDLIIDALPHARLRYNILRAIMTSQIDAEALSRDLRHSGALEQVHGSWQRCGLIVWGSPDEVQSWEISVGFLRRWGFLLQGCEDLLAATNSWRAQRGEAKFPASINLS